MDHLPQNPIMLVSSINMLLRDNEFDSLESICSYFDRDIKEIISTLNSNGYEYNSELNQIRPI